MWLVCGDGDNYNIDWLIGEIEVANNIKRQRNERLTKASRGEARWDSAQRSLASWQGRRRHLLRQARKPSSPHSLRALRLRVCARAYRSRAARTFAPANVCESRVSATSPPAAGLSAIMQITRGAQPVSQFLRSCASSGALVSPEEIFPSKSVLLFSGDATKCLWWAVNHVGDARALVRKARILWRNGNFYPWETGSCKEFVFWVTEFIPLCIGCGFCPLVRRGEI